VILNPTTVVGFFEDYELFVIRLDSPNPATLFLENISKTAVKHIIARRDDHRFYVKRIEKSNYRLYVCTLDHHAPIDVQQVSYIRSTGTVCRIAVAEDLDTVATLDESASGYWLSIHTPHNSITHQLSVPLNPTDWNIHLMRDKLLVLQLKTKLTLFSIGSDGIEQLPTSIYHSSANEKWDIDAVTMDARLNELYVSYGLDWRYRFSREPTIERYKFHENGREWHLEDTIKVDYDNKVVICASSSMLEDWRTSTYRRLASSKHFQDELTVHR
jgi:hypothetical protein